MESRYIRQIQLSEIGIEGQTKLKQSSVLVVGAGGLGCPVLVYLANAGVGILGICDSDLIEESNLARQILYTINDIGKNKAKCAAKKIKTFNPSIQINVHPYSLNHKNALEIVKDYDIIVDGTDNFSTRYLINDSCILKNKPMVYGGLFKFEGQISVFNYNSGPSYRCLFPNPPKIMEVPNCNETGVLNITPGIIGMYQATEVLKIILNIGTPLSGKLLLINLLTQNHLIWDFKINKREIKRVQKNMSPLLSSIQDCILDFEISLKELNEKVPIHWIDVREKEEKPRLNFSKITELPLEKISSFDFLTKDKSKKIIFCQTGTRSKKALIKMKKQGIDNCYCLKEGAIELKTWGKLK